MTIGLVGRCQAANATLFAMRQHPEQFTGVRCPVAPRPLSVGVTMRRILELLGIPERRGELAREPQLQAGFTFDEMTPAPWAKSDTIPNYLYQVRDDLLITPADVQAIYDSSGRRHLESMSPRPRPAINETAATLSPLLQICDDLRSGREPPFLRDVFGVCFGGTPVDDERRRDVRVPQSVLISHALHIEEPERRN